jgi:serine protease Do
MKKFAWISIASFSLGILAAGYVFIIMPEKKAEAKSFLDNSSGALGASLFAQSDSAKPDLDFVKISDKIGPAVVKLESERVEKAATVQGSPDDGGGQDDFWNRFFNNPNQRRQDMRVTVQGTGFIVSPDGYIITNNHLAEKSEKLTVTLVGGENFRAKVVGLDPLTDLALIKIEGKNLPTVELGDSGKVRVGEWVLAIGNPLGMEHTVTAGIISAKGRQLGLGGNAPTYQDFLQTDAAINRGNSGGPLVNMKGEVIGINSNILTPTGGSIGIGFAIPSNLAKKVVSQLKEKGKVVRGYLGLSPIDIDDDTKDALKLKDKKGALINSVEAGTPAAKAGLIQYDVVVGVNGQDVKDQNDLRFKIADIQPGTKVDLKIIRDGKAMNLTATVAELEANTQRQTQLKPGKDVGITVTELTASTARRYGYRTREGLLITDVAQGSEAERKGLEAGNILLEVNRVKVSTVDQWDKILEKAPAGSVLMLLIRREGNGQSQDVIVTVRIP